MHFLVATDGSADSERTIDHAIEVAGAAEATLTVVHVVSPRIHAEGATPVRSLSDAERRLILEDVEDAEARGESILEDARERIADAGVDVETELLYGEPVDGIAEYADPERHDGLFVGHRGLSDRAEALLGSVASELIRRAPVPVTVVR